jgi:hypothetical protein
MPLTDADMLLPALSETLTGPAPRSAPTPSITLSPGTESGSMPESASVPVQWIVTSPRYQPAAFASVVGAPLSSGAVRSMLTSFTVASALLPALSTAVPWAD